MPPDRLSRRNVLRLSGLALAGLSGCGSNTRGVTQTPTDIGGGSSPTSSAISSTPTPSTNTPTVQPTPDPITTTDFSFDVEIRQGFSSEHPARVEATFTNTADGPLMLAGHEILPFSGYVGAREGGEGRLILVPDENSWMDPIDEDHNSLDTPLIPELPRYGCWTVNYEKITHTLTLIRGPIEPAESISHQYTLLDWNNDSCLPPGTYQFSQENQLGRGNFENPSPMQAVVDLGFSIAVDAGQGLSISVREPVIQPKDEN